jgi:hypothetical protein
MSEDKGKKVKKRIKVRKKVDKRKSKRVRRWKEAGHQIFSLIIVLFLFVASYFLIWGLIIEPNLPRHVYGLGDIKETIYLLASLLIIAISYLAILIIRYKPLGFWWWNNFLLFASVKFNLDKYSAMRNLGIRYHPKKKNTKKVRHHHVHKSITEE